jgi:hypothetical protein
MEINELKLLLSEDIDAVFEFLKNNTTNNPQLFDDFIIAFSRHKDLKRQDNNGVLRPMEKNIELNKIRGSVLAIINSLFQISEEKNVKKNSNNDLEMNTPEEDGKGDELGLFDIEENLLQNSNDLKLNLNRISDCTKKMGDGIRENANRLTKFNKSNNKPNKVFTRKIFDNASKTIDIYSERLKIEVPIFANLTKNNVNYSLTYISKLYESGLFDSKEEFVYFKSATENLIDESKDSRVSLDGLYKEITKVPSLTTNFEKSRKRVLKELDSFFIPFDNYLNKLEILKQGINDTLNELDN